MTIFSTGQPRSRRSCQVQSRLLLIKPLIVWEIVFSAAGMHTKTKLRLAAKHIFSVKPSMCTVEQICSRLKVRGGVSSSKEIIEVY